MVWLLLIPEKILSIGLSGGRLCVVVCTRRLNDDIAPTCGFMSALTVTVCC